MAQNIQNIRGIAELEALINESEKPVVVDFWAPWCGPCHALGPILEGVANTLGDDVVIAKVNIDDNAELARENRVVSIPTLFYYSGGDIRHSQIGIPLQEEIIDKVEQLSAQTVQI